MTIEEKEQAEVRKYITTMLNQHFGEVPASVKVLIQLPFVAIHLSGFVLPTEQALLKHSQSKRILETRELLLNGLKPELKAALEEITGQFIEEFYTDWNLENETALLLAVTRQDETMDSAGWPDEGVKEKVLEEVIHASKKTLKEPEWTNIYWLDGYAILIERSGIMMDLEKEFIKKGMIEELRLARRPLEQHLMKSPKLKAILKQEIRELFVDWNFEHDKAYMVLVLEPKNG